MSKKEERKEPTAESTLAPQLGSDIKDLTTQHKVDMRRLSNINPIDKAWISFFLLVDDEEDGGYFKEFCEQYLNLSVSEEGWRVNKIIQAIASSKGATGVGELMKRPGWLGRNISQRDWKKKADEEGKTIVE